MEPGPSHKQSKTNSMIMNGVKERNKYSRSILKLKVGVKAKNQMSTTLSKISASSKEDMKMKRIKTIDKMGSATGHMGSIARMSSKERMEEEDKIPIEDYFCNDSESSDSSEEDGEAAGGSLMAGLEESELMKKNPEELIDKSLTGLLQKMRGFPPSTEAQIEERAVTFGESQRHKTLIFDMDETLIHAEILPKDDPPIEGSDF